jgi:hypothetical protein
LLGFEGEVAALEEVDESDGLLPTFVCDGDSLLKNVRIAIGVRGGGVWGSTLRTAQRSMTNDCAFDRSAAAESLHFSKNSDGVTCERV